MLLAKLNSEVTAVTGKETQKNGVEVEKLEADLLSQLQSARTEALKIVNEAEKDSDKLYQEAVELANNEANASKEKSRLEIENQTSSARKQLSDQADEISELIVNKLIQSK